MKISVFIYLFLLLSAGPANAQDTTDGIYHLSKIPPEGLKLDNGWKFQSGDNPGWAKTDFNDSGWIYLNINESISKLATLTKSNMYWLRLWFTINTNLRDTLLALLITQYGASDVYIDGQLFQRFGKISPSKEHVIF